MNCPDSDVKEWGQNIIYCLMTNDTSALFHCLDVVIIAIEQELLDMRIKGLLPTAPAATSAKKFLWTGKATDLVELLYALDTCDCINNGEIGVEELADAFSEIFGVEIKNCYNVYMNMKRRKDDSRTYFLDELREKLNRRMVESDLKGGKFKKR